MTFLKNLFFVVFSLFILNVFAQKSTAVKTYKVGIIGFYNLENYYDTIDQPNIKDDEYTPNGEKKYTGEIYKDKINRLATKPPINTPAKNAPASIPESRSAICFLLTCEINRPNSNTVILTNHARNMRIQ